MESDLYSFRCKECNFIFLEPFDVDNRFEEMPNCPDCGAESELYDEELSDELKNLAEEYNKREIL